jgi:hypothetical protein
MKSCYKSNSEPVPTGVGLASLPCRAVDIFREVKALDLPFGEYVVFGSGPLAAHGIRPTSDVDLFVTTMLYEKLKAERLGRQGTAHPARRALPVPRHLRC